MGTEAAIGAETGVDVALYDLFGGIGRFGSRPAVIFGSAALSYADLVDQRDRLAAYLADRGVRPSTPVALAMSNCPEFVVADQALIRLGAAKVPINDMLSAPEIDYILADSGATIVVVDAGLLPLVEAAGRPDLTLIVIGDQVPAGQTAWSDALACGAELPTVTRRGRGDDLGMILYTGGTTGRQKGVVHSQSGLAINMLAHVIEMGLGDDERVLVTTPLPHAAGLIAQAALLRGGTVFLERRFDAARAIELVAERGVTYAFMVPTMIYRLLDAAIAAQSADLSSLRTILYGAAPMSQTRLKQGLELFGPVFMQLYGQSEAPDFVTRLTRQDHLTDGYRLLSSCGRAVPLMEVAIVGDDGVELPRGEVGEVTCRGPYVMRGYHNLPDETARALRSGWLHTGDVGWMDADGYVYIVDRLKDMIISGGMNVYTSEVELVVQACPSVAQVAVVGLPHPDWGEAVSAFVVGREGQPPDRDEIDRVCRAQLSAYKRPKLIMSVAELPLTPYGKVDKKALRNLVPAAAEGMG